MYMKLFVLRGERMQMIIGRVFDRVLVYGMVWALWVGSWGNIDMGASAGQNGQRKPADSIETGSRRKEKEEDKRGSKEQDQEDSREGEGQVTEEAEESSYRQPEDQEGKDREAENQEGKDREAENQEGKDREAENQEGKDQEAEDQSAEAQEPPKPVSFGSVPYFKDDAGNNTQLVDGWLYGYWSRQLCRVNPKTLESEVLFEAASPQEGYFSIYEGMIYFVEQKNISYLDGTRVNLWRMKCDGSGKKLLVKDFVIGEGYDIGGSSLTDMEIHDDILYLLSGFSAGDENRYFQLQGDGSVKEISEEETLYGMVPEGFSEARDIGYRYRYLPNLVYCVRNFGYTFICDEDENLYRIILETGEKERILLQDAGSMSNLTLTNRALVYRNDDTWYAVSLDDPNETKEIGVLDCYSMTFWDDKGIYDIERDYEDNSFSVMRLSWDGERESIDSWVQNPRSRDSVYGDYLTVLYSDGDYLYYDKLLDGDGAICRIPYERDDSYYYDDMSERVYVYYENPLKEMATEETFSSTFIVESTGARGSFGLTKVYLTEKSETALRINEYLEEIYRAEEEYITGLMDVVRNTPLDELFGSDLMVVEDELKLSITFLDENYIGVSAYWYEYWNGAAHGQHGSTEYVFSRSSGERVLLTEILENSPEEICAIIAPYVEAKAEWGTDEEGWEKMILEEGRFYLTTEGIGIHFDAYELTCYASGGLDVVVPYELFTLRDPADVGLTSF